MHRDVKPHNVMIDHEKKQVIYLYWYLVAAHWLGIGWILSSWNCLQC
jgi:serine/threonine protein kinase